MYMSAPFYLDLEPEEMMMCAAHVSDLQSARSYGLRTGSIYRCAFRRIERLYELPGFRPFSASVPADADPVRKTGLPGDVLPFR